MRKCSLVFPRRIVKTVSVLQNCGGGGGSRTRDLCRDGAAWIGFTTYKNVGTAKRSVSQTRPVNLWVGLWVGEIRT